MKLEILKETWRGRISLFPSAIGSLAGPPWGYRNRIRLHVTKVPSIGLGYRQRGSHNLLPVTHCPIAAPLLEQAIAAVARISGETGLARLCDEVEFFTNSEQDQLLVSLWSGRQQPRRTRERALEELRRAAVQRSFPRSPGLDFFRLESPRARSCTGDSASSPTPSPDTPTR